MGRMFGMDQQTLVQMAFTFANVVVLALILWRLLYKPVREFMLKRTMRIREQLQFAESEQARVAELKSQYEAKLRDIEQEKLEILDSARKLAAERTKQQLDEARIEADSLKARASKEIEMEQERVRDEMKRAIIDCSSSLAAKFLGRNIDTDTHERLFNETMAELEGVQWHS